MKVLNVNYKMSMKRKINNIYIGKNEYKLGLSWAKLSCKLEFYCTVINVCCLILINKLGLSFAKLSTA